jgi:hypothetical protein
MLEDAHPFFTGRQPEQIKYRPGKTPDPDDLQYAFRVKNNGLIEQTHHKGRWQGLQTARTGNAATVSEMKDNFRVPIRHDLEIRLLFSEIPSVIPKALDRIPQLLRRLKFLVQ